MADPQVTLDIGGAVSAGYSVLQGVQSALTGTRSATIEIDNNTESHAQVLCEWHLQRRLGKISRSQDCAYDTHGLWYTK